MGAQPESQVRAFIDRLVGGGRRRRRHRRSPRDRPRPRSSRATCRAQPKPTPPCCRRISRTSQALAGLARCYLKSGDTARAEQTLALVPPDKRTAAVVESAKRRARARQDGRQGRQPRRARAAPRRQSRRSPGPLRSGRRACRARQQRGGARSLADIMRKRSQMERGGRPQAARSALRRLGSEGSADTRRPPPIVVDSVSS